MDDILLQQKALAQKIIELQSEICSIEGSYSQSNPGAVLALREKRKALDTCYRDFHKTMLSAASQRKPGETAHGKE